jgi:hypothetical protein
MAEEHFFLIVAIGDMPSLSEKPQRVTMARASFVACSISEEAPR